jgi:hypothetical protein
MRILLASAFIACIMVSPTSSASADEAGVRAELEREAAA